MGFLLSFSTLILPRPRILFRRKEVQCTPGFSLPLLGHYSLFLLILQRFITYVVLGEPLIRAIPLLLISMSVLAIDSLIHSLAREG